MAPILYVFGQLSARTTKTPGHPVFASNAVFIVYINVIHVVNAIHVVRSVALSACVSSLFEQTTRNRPVTTTEHVVGQA